ncbi:MAG TPA: efflux RND transporter permease subunit [Myxococcota bacterium]|nr:efflux RND transporter permease subunit [Myxococcota bacterium]
MTDVSIKRPVFITMVATGLLILGLLSLGRLGLDLFPNTSFGFVVVNTVYPGAAPTEVEQRVTDKIEEAVSSINGVDKVQSTSRYSFSQLFIQFELDVDERQAADEVAEKVNAIRATLPPDIEDPAVLRLDPTAIPIMTFAVRSQLDPTMLRDYVDDVVRPAVQKVDGVASVVIKGASDREVHIEVDREKMERYGLTLAMVAQRVGGEVLDVPSGRIELGAREESVKTAGRPRSVEELQATIVMPLPGGTSVLLSDIATVSLGLEENRTLSRVNGEPAVTFDIQKQGGANTVEVSKEVDKALAQLKAVEGIKIEKIIDASDFIKINVGHLWEHLIVGGLMAVLVIFLFMLDWRSTLISSIALPVSIITTFFFMWQLGFTLNIMSMLGLTLAVGILIDDSVVVRENIFRHLEMGKDPKAAASEGTKEIALAVLATTFTILAVFVPVAFTGGMVGKFFKEFGLTVAISVVVSMLVSFTLDPMLSTKITQKIEDDHHEKMRKKFFIGHLLRFYEGMDKAYVGALKWVQRLTVSAAVFAMVGSCGLAGMMGQDFAPRGDRGEFTVAVELPAGSSLEKSTEVAKQIEDTLKAHPHFKQVATTVGPNEEVEKIQMRVTMTKRHQREEPLGQILEWLRGELHKIPGIEFYMREAGLGDGSLDEAPVTIFVTGPELDELGQVAGMLLQETRKTSGVRDATMTYRPGAIESRVHLDRAKAADRGVANQEVAMTLRYALEGVEVGKMIRGEEDIPVRLKLQEEDRQNLDALMQLKVSSMSGGPNGPKLVPLEQVTSVEPATSPSAVKRLDRGRQVTITANLYKRTLGEVMPELSEKFAKLTLPEGYSFRFGGEAERLQETQENMGLAFLLGIMFIYLVLASQFESFIHPLTIMVALPLAFIGANIGLFITNQDGSLSTMIGMILLMGLVTKNSILLIDYANQLREQGMTIHDALLTAGPTRLRPILMTSAAIILGMLPAAIGTGEGSEFYAPMSIAVIGGVITSTLLTLVVVPVFYVWFDRLTIRGRRERKLEKAQLRAEKAAKKAAKLAGKKPSAAVEGTMPGVMARE